MCENTKKLALCVKTRNHCAVGNNTKILKDDKSPLLPDRMQQADFFVCDIFDAAPKGDVASMEHPIFSVATKPDLKSRRYDNGPHWVEIKPSSDGIATVHDRDVLIFCISQVMAALNDGRAVTQTLRFKAHDLLLSTNRGTDGRGYQQLKAAFSRLRGTTIETNVMTDGKEELDGFGLIDSYKIVRETRDGRMQDIEIKLSDWVFNAIKAREVLTISRDYFRLRKPLERRLYEIARKHCGAQKEWKIGLDKLQNKVGSNSTLREFRRLLGSIVAQDETHSHIPDYAIRFEPDADMVHFYSRGTVPKKFKASSKAASAIQLDPDIYEEARRCAPGWDIHHLEREWRNWMTEPPRNPDKAFLGFCRKTYELKGRP